MIKQRTPSDCAICCMAMLTGRPYEDVMQVVGDAFDPERGMRQEQKALQRLGFVYRFDNGRLTDDSTMACRHRAFEIAPEFFRGLAWGRRALLSVPSLNIPGGWHMVYYDGREVLDPSTRKTYSAFEELRPDDIVIFREAAP